MFLYQMKEYIFELESVWLKHTQTSIRTYSFSIAKQLKVLVKHKRQFAYDPCQLKKQHEQQHKLQLFDQFWIQFLHIDVLMFVIVAIVLLNEFWKLQIKRNSQIQHYLEHVWKIKHLSSCSLFRGCICMYRYTMILNQMEKKRKLYRRS